MINSNRIQTYFEASPGLTAYVQYGHEEQEDAGLDQEAYSGSVSLVVPALLWIGLWFGINTGHWVLRQVPETFMGWIHLIRTVYPFFAALVAGFLLARTGGRSLWKQLGPVRLWFVYGVVSLLACISSPSLLAAVYWSGVYLSVFPVLLLFWDGRDPLNSIVRLNRLNFVCAGFFLVFMLIVARNSLFVGSGLETSAYGIVGRVSTIEGAAMSRSSGLARFGAVIGILSFIYLWRVRGWRRLVWIIPFLSIPAFLYTLQSRTAIAGYAVSIALLVVVMSVRYRRVLLVPVVLLLGLAVFADRIPFGRIQEHITRGQDLEELKTLGGRIDTWHRAYPVISASPVWGWGMQADRYLLSDSYEHVHDTYLYAMLTTGVLGTAAFVVGLVWAWRLMFRAVKIAANKDAPRQSTFVYEALGILTFFTVRSISEVSGPLFGVDYMLMLPVIAYLSLLSKSFDECVTDVDRMPEDTLESYGNSISII